MKVHGAIGVVRRSGKILIAKRPVGKHLAGYWEFPGGRVEPGETSEEALKREFLEELALVVTITGRGPALDWDYGDTQVHLDVFFCEAPGGEPKPLGCETTRWVAPEELRDFTFPPANAPLLAILQDPA